MPLAAGDRLGPYEILAPLGKGGMGEVYRARDTRLGRDVAIKVSAEQFSERFEREAKAVAALNHPNICSLFDVGPNFIVMELVEGPTLAERIAEGAMPIDEALHVAAQIAEALQTAHDNAIVHRDLKPGNVKIKPDGAVKVLDFGLAKVGPTPAAPQSENSPTLSMAATQAGMILGTAGYMSPEQARGKPVDKRADIWAFGVVLYEMLTGKRLFEGEDVVETLAAVVHKEPDWKLTPARVQGVLQRCLVKDPKKRLRDISGVGLLLEEKPQAESPRLQSWLGRAAWAVAGLAVLVAAALAFVHFRETPPVQQSVRFQIAPPDKASIQEFALSPDGRYLAFVDQIDASRRLWVRPLDTLESRVLPGTEGALYPFWSPDGAYIGFFAGSKLKKIAVTGGPAVALCESGGTRGGTWGRDNVILFSPAAGGIYRVAAAGGVPALVTHPKGSETHVFPQFLPGGRFLYTVIAEPGGIFAGSLDGKPPVSILPDVSNAMYVPPAAAGATGHVLFRRDGTLMALPFDPEKIRATGDVFPVAERVGNARATYVGAFSASENGALAFGIGLGGGGRQLVWLDRSGKRLGVATKPLAICCGGHLLSPDETRAVVALISEGEVNIWLEDLVRGASSRFSFTGRAGSAAWSPDGTRVAFAPRLADSTPIYVKPVSGAGKEELLARVGLNGNVMDWSRDGKFLLADDQSEKTGQDLWLVPLEGDHKPVPYLQSRFNESQGAFSPDGKWIAYTSNESGQVQVWVESVPAGSGRWQISTEGGTYPRWRRDGRELYYLQGQKLLAVPMKINAASVEAGKPQELFGGVDSRFQVSADGQKFLVNVPAEGESTAPPITVVLNWAAGLRK